MVNSCIKWSKIIFKFNIFLSFKNFITSFFNNLCFKKKERYFLFKKILSILYASTSTAYPPKSSSGPSANIITLLFFFL